MKKVLFLTFNFYPRNDSALQRVAGFYKHLPKYGWEPSVICPRWERDNCELFDEGMVADFQSANVLSAYPYYRSKYNGSLGRIRFGLRQLLNPPMAFNRLCHRIRPAALMRVPEEVYYESKRSIRQAMQSQHFDAIYATCPPPATLAIADWASRKYNIPWVADFRDNLDQDSLTRSKTHAQRLVSQEKPLLVSASAILSVSEPLAEQLEERHGDRVRVITNGYAPELLDTSFLPPKNERFTLAYLGRLIRNHRDPRPLFEAVEKMIHSGLIASSEIAIDFYGPNQEELAPYYKGLSLVPESIQARGWVDHKQSIQVQRSADVLLHLAHAGERGILTGKLFEYLAAQRPVLCIPGDIDGASELIERTQSGISCKTSDEVEVQLREWILQWKASQSLSINPNLDYIRQFSRSSLAQQLGEVLDSMSL